MEMPKKIPVFLSSQHRQRLESEWLYCWGHGLGPIYLVLSNALSYRTDKSQLHSTKSTSEVNASRTIYYQRIITSWRQEETLFFSISYSAASLPILPCSLFLEHQGTEKHGEKTRKAQKTRKAENGSHCGLSSYPLLPWCTYKQWFIWWKFYSASIKPTYILTKTASAWNFGCLTSARAINELKVMAHETCLFNLALHMTAWQSSGA